MSGFSKFRNFFRRLFRKKGGVWVQTDENSPFVKLPEGTSIKWYPDGKKEVPLSSEASVHITFEHAETVHKRYWNREDKDDE